MGNFSPFITHKFIDYGYLKLIHLVLKYGYNQKRRNSVCRTMVGCHLALNYISDVFPLLLCREIKYKGVFGELAALVRGPKHIDDFKKWGCNYWDQFANSDGSLKVDYGNAWRQPVDQLANAMSMLKEDPYSRRIMVDGWVPENISDLTLPCCHFAYQYVCVGDQINLVWYQRSADLMVGVPSDVILAALMLIGGAEASGLKAGTIRMFFGDLHIYKEHLAEAHKMLDDNIERAKAFGFNDYPTYKLRGMDLLNFTPDMIKVIGYDTSLSGKYKFACIK